MYTKNTYIHEYRQDRQTDRPTDRQTDRCTYIYIYICKYAHIYVYEVCMYIYISTSVARFTSIFISISRFTSICTSISLCVYVCILMKTVYACMYTYINIHTYTHWRPSHRQTLIPKPYTRTRKQNSKVT